MTQTNVSQHSTTWCNVTKTQPLLEYYPDMKFQIFLRLEIMADIQQYRESRLLSEENIFGFSVDLVLKIEFICLFKNHNNFSLFRESDLDLRNRLQFWSTFFTTHIMHESLECVNTLI